MWNQLDCLVASKEEKTDHHHHLVGSGCSIDRIREASINLPNVQMATLECKELFSRCNFRTLSAQLRCFTSNAGKKCPYAHLMSRRFTHRDSIKVWPIRHCPFALDDHICLTNFSNSQFIIISSSSGRCVTHHLRSLSHASVKSVEPPFESFSRSMFDPWWSFFSRSINLFIQI